MDGVSSGHCSGFSNGVNGVVTRLMDDRELRLTSDASASTLLRCDETVTVEADDGVRDGKDVGLDVALFGDWLLDEAEDDSEPVLLVEAELEAEFERLLFSATFPLFANTKGGGLGFDFVDRLVASFRGGSSAAGTLEVESFFSRPAVSALRTLYAM